jgi:hypothetical protein
MSVNISINTNTVAVQENINYISVNDPNNPNIVDITQPVTNVVEVITAGPQGPPGPPGTGSIANTGSFVTTASFNAYTGSSTSQFAGTASFATQALSASFAISSSRAISSSFATTASYSTQALSASYIPTLQQVTDAGAVTTNQIIVNPPFNSGIVVNSPEGGIEINASSTGLSVYGPTYGINVNAGVGIQTLGNTLGILAKGISGPAGIFNIDSSNASNIVEFQRNEINQAYITQDGIIVSNKSLINTTVDNGVDKLQISGSTNLIGNTKITGSLNVTQGITGSLFGTSSYARNAATSSNILGGKATHIPYFITDTTLATSSLYQSGSTSVIINQDNNTTANPEALYVWQPHPTSFNVVSGKGNINNYLQLNIQNTNQGANASSDIVATANNGDENSNYIDMGINSQNFSGFLGGPNDSYLYTHARNFWIGNINDGYNTYFFNSSSLLPIITLTSNSAKVTGSLFGTASWASNAVNATNAANATSASRATVADSATYATTAGNGGVTSIIAGSGITILPSGGTGAVTIISAGGGGTTIISGSAVTSSFTNSNTWTFNHNLGTRTPTITVFDSSYNQIIPQNISLDTTASATITFPTLESGFAIASTGGTTGTALSSSYSLFSTYATSASYYPETDPVFVSKSGSLATTGSNTFIGNQTVTGSLFTSGSNTLVGNTILSGSVSISGSTTIKGITNFSDSSTTITGSLNITGSTTQTGNNTLIGTTTLTGSIFINGNIIPQISASFDLGSVTNPWRTIYLQSGSISIQSDIIGGIPAIISNANGNVTVAGAGFQLKSGSFVPFEISSSARTIIRVPNIPANDVGGLSIIGSSDGSYQGVTNAGGLLHLTSNDGQSSRITSDAFGITSVASYVGRKARGTAASPLPVQSGDTLTRISTIGWTGPEYGFLMSASSTVASTAIETVALENFTTSSFGTRYAFYNAPLGGTIRTLSATIDTTGITIPSSSRLFGTSSWALNTISSSNALTASYVNPLNQAVQITGSLLVTGSTTHKGNIIVTGSVDISGSIIMDSTAQTNILKTAVTNPSAHVIHTFPTASYHGASYMFSAIEDSTNKSTTYNVLVSQGNNKVANIQTYLIKSEGSAPVPTIATAINAGNVELRVTDTGTFTYRGIVQLF